MQAQVAQVGHTTERKEPIYLVDQSVVTFHIFNTARRKRLKIHDFEQSFVESRCCCRRVESRSPTVTRVEQRRTEHHIVAGRAMSLTTPQT